MAMTWIWTGMVVLSLVFGLFTGNLDAVGLVGQTAGLENDFLAAHGGRDAGRIEDILVHVDLV